jgi:hypothetical protein
MPSEIIFEDAITATFRLRRLIFALDGQILYREVDVSGALAEQPEVLVYGGPIPIGDHTISMELLFDRLEYRFELKSTHEVTITNGNALMVTARAKEDTVMFLEQHLTGPTVMWSHRVQVAHPSTAAAPTAPQP